MTELYEKSTVPCDEDARDANNDAEPPFGSEDVINDETGTLQISGIDMTDSSCEADDELARTIEAILFAAGHPVTYERIAVATGMPAYEIKRVARMLAPRYNDDDSSRGIMLLLFEDSCQLCTKERYAPMIREALGIRRGGNLSSSSMEVLAVIAYNQPCTRSYVDMVRGVDSGYVVTSLHEKGLIEQRGRLDVPGRPILYGTTDTFLRVFGLSSIEELPAVSSMREGGEAPEQETISTEQLL